MPEDCHVGSVHGQTRAALQKKVTNLKDLVNDRRDHSVWNGCANGSVMPDHDHPITRFAFRTLRLALRTTSDRNDIFQVLPAEVEALMRVRMHLQDGLSFPHEQAPEHVHVVDLPAYPVKETFVLFRNQAGDPDCYWISDVAIDLVKGEYDAECWALPSSLPEHHALSIGYDDLAGTPTITGLEVKDSTTVGELIKHLLTFHPNDHLVVRSPTGDSDSNLRFDRYAETVILEIDRKDEG